MDISIVLTTAFIALIGEVLCQIEKGTVEEIADMPGLCPWCESPTLKMLYGMLQIAGVIFVLGITAYLTFTEDWWYILVYLGGRIAASIIVYIIKLLLLPVYKMYSHHMLIHVKINRCIGSCFILIGILSFLFFV